jgi:hypothetical protein
MAITSTIWSMGTCTTRMATIATITARSRSLDPSSRSAMATSN